MDARINDTQARALAALVATLRPDWGAAGIRKALWDARDKGSAAQLIHAAINAATDPTVRYPGVLSHDGPHWAAVRPFEDARPAQVTRCPEPGHQSYPKWQCGACRAEEIAADEPRPVEQQADPETYRRGAELVRAALTTTPARAAAGDRREDHR